MKRTSLELPDELLHELVELTGEKTQSAAVVAAVKEYVRSTRVRQILKLKGSGAWQGDLREMRGETVKRRRRKAR